jgi:hypothetical protein
MNKMHDWVGYRLAGDDEGRTITGTAIMSYQYGSCIRRASSGEQRQQGPWRNVTPPRPTTWLSLVGAVERGHTDQVNAIAASWLKPAGKIDANWIYCGFSYQDRAYVFCPIEKDGNVFECTFSQCALYNPIIILEKTARRIKGIEINGAAAKSYACQKEGARTIVWIGWRSVKDTTVRIVLDR